MDPTQPLDVSARIDSPQVVVYRLWFLKPGDTAWTLFGNGNDEDSSGAAGKSFTVGPLPAGSKVGYQFILSGNPVTAFRIDLTMAQGGVTLPDATLLLEGNTDETGVAVRQGQVAL